MTIKKDKQIRGSSLFYFVTFKENNLATIAMRTTKTTKKVIWDNISFSTNKIKKVKRKYSKIRYFMGFLFKFDI